MAATLAAVAEVRRATQQLDRGSSAHPQTHQEEGDTAGRLTLSDFMTLAYVVSTMYKRVHPEKKADERRRVKPYNEAPVLYALLVFVVWCVGGPRRERRSCATPHDCCFGWARAHVPAGGWR